MVSMIAWLADQYDIDTRPGSRVKFRSRGSNRWPKGARVTTRTIEGHRKMSLTACPGDAAYPFVRKRLPKLATRVRRRGRTPQGRPRFNQQDRANAKFPHRLVLSVSPFASPVTRNDGHINGTHRGLSFVSRIASQVARSC